MRANPFKRHVDVEEATFLRAVGDVTGKGVLDLACGTGHYARLLKARGAANVHGVDNSEELLKEARRHESADGVTYYRHDLIEGPPPKPLFQPDIVIASWLLPYASNFNELLEFCEAAAVNLESGGRFVGITTLFTDFIAGRVTTAGGGKIETDPLTRSLHWESHPHDGMTATVSIFLHGGPADARDVSQSPLVQALGRARAGSFGLREDQLGAARGGRRARHRGELRGARGRVHGAACVSPGWYLSRLSNVAYMGEWVAYFRPPV